ncbi:unnamed protein product [Pleuronectes platessa]|uniref:Uncharacterized protein n=1 Tax=Pleuronectes platessa TaxID=8262 RepID=A0A9N7TWN4_PLEPL|nr:unnamed protein product [Pleuronectes platessa]
MNLSVGGFQKDTSPERSRREPREKKSGFEGFHCAWCEAAAQKTLQQNSSDFTFSPPPPPHLEPSLLPL